ncbi:hypothetical protein [Nocardioides jiangxiensis]|uniref:DUF3558 domain-containing protein n=1 Tax=Nocardioides jiangxiensis TaxID=3064524 RepID=A0ABT9B755_9ACTN|nr:hypothetical protein [Nocardioides sp. WY-20]MDO7868968.1 hypothetical protein [Nocardioides sp. WY-20]
MARRTGSVRTWRSVCAVAWASLAGALLAGCGGGPTPPPAAPEPTPLASYDGTVAHVERISFCSRIPARAVLEAVGTKDVTTAHYGNGERLPGTEDLSHEYGCVFAHGDVVARSWVFVPPVTPAQAAQLVAAARKTPGCHTTPAARFGSPAVGTVCSSSAGRTVTYRGLFGDAWLACSVAAPAKEASEADLVARAGDWCVQVATTASSS